MRNRRKIIAHRLKSEDYPFVRNSMLNDILMKKLTDRLNDRIFELRVKYNRLDGDIKSWKERRDDLWLGHDIIELCKELNLL